ncbi:nuclear transport factor 2 family protein [Parasphingopyxis marina]|uniref:Nuclear transport factor 2 family protein n=1 Tax=Parasphingopyxis marina TaxID=2761622 RepID=A0A842HUS6_9SPHN|nr:nuclear transport factor 2 family protein [Parasphingopyxis marina]MBC2777748.1 nuclear transport factor 2 family protein [Parasphingopyxis marina]
MGVAENKAVLQQAFAETARGNGRPFVDMMADDVRWSIIGSTAWSRVYEGKADVLANLLGPLATNFNGPNTVTAERFIGEGDLVAVEGRNHSVTHDGMAYANRYCWVFTFRGGKVAEIVEYCDTDLINRALTPPA